MEKAIEDGRAYFVTTGVLDITSDTESGILYVKNTSERDIFVVGTQTYLGESTGGTGPSIPKLYINPNAGTLITGTEGVDYTVGTAVNSNTSKLLSDPFDGIIRVGGEGTTLSSAFPAVPSLMTPPGETRPIIAAVVPKGGALAAGFVPPPGNTSMKLVVNTQFYYLDI